MGLYRILWDADERPAITAVLLSVIRLSLEVHVEIQDQRRIGVLTQVIAQINLTSQLAQHYSRRERF